MEEVRSNSGQTLGIIALVLGILTLFIGFIPCIGFVAFIPGVIAIILSIIGLSKANKDNGAIGLNIGALIVSVLGVLVASLWLFFFVGVASMNEDEIEGFVEEVIEEVIEESVHNQDLQEALEELEQQLEEINIDSIANEVDSLEMKIKVEIETNKKQE
ncbi:hypothetical protein [Marinifilum sp. D737]|uniref:hypothetical protein n=1 Tax=Marinifilum sp. D737 TaxID=2969628 RepID=UPI0022739776|nr:hypothetical protein [Marinifilum sp. D737]MCY1635123.1 hypothetical protein [Marinifilum sp. D737]